MAQWWCNNEQSKAVFIDLLVYNRLFDRLFIQILANCYIVYFYRIFIFSDLLQLTLYQIFDQQISIKDNTELFIIKCKKKKKKVEYIVFVFTLRVHKHFLVNFQN